jgi:hypothetical protein
MDVEPDTAGVRLTRISVSAPIIDYFKLYLALYAAFNHIEIYYIEDLQFDEPALSLFTSLSLSLSLSLSYWHSQLKTERNALQI